MNKRAMPILLMMALLLFVSLSSTVQPAQAQAQPLAGSHDRINVFNTITKKAYTQTYDWSIQKTAANSSLTLLPGQSAVMDYTVTVNRSLSNVSVYIEGQLEIINYNAQPAVVEGIQVEFVPGKILASNINCERSLPVTLAPGDSFLCTYRLDLPSPATGYSVARVSAKIGGSNASNIGQALVIFINPMQIVNTNVEVHDPMAGGLLFTATSTDPMPRTFTYTAQIGPFSQCGDTPVVNTASIKDTQSGAIIAESSATVLVTVPCDGGGDKNCVQGQGYWKTHTKYDKFPDPAWARVTPAGEDSIFFLSEQTWYEVLTTEPRGNAYYILAHQFIAASLNQLQGADTSAINAQLDYAEQLLSAYPPEPAVSGELRRDFINTASILERFNTGKLGPDSCK